MAYFDATFSNWTGIIVPGLSNNTQIVFENENFGPPGEKTYTVLKGTFTPGTVDDFSTYTGEIETIEQVVDDAGALGRVGVVITTDAAERPTLEDLFAAMPDSDIAIQLAWFDHPEFEAAEWSDEPEFSQDGSYIRDTVLIDGAPGPTYVVYEGENLPTSLGEPFDGTISRIAHVDGNNIVISGRETVFAPPVPFEDVVGVLKGGTDAVKDYLLAGDETIDSSMAWQDDSVALPNSPGDDTFITAGPASESIGFWDATGPITVDLTKGVIQDDTGGEDTIIGPIEAVYGSDFNDTIVGHPGNNFIGIGQGDDRVTTGGGNDTVLISRPWNMGPEGIGNSVITDFDPANDRIAVGGFDDVGVTSSADLEVSEDGDGNAVLRFPEASGVAGSVTLQDVSQAQWEAACFPAGTLIETSDGPRAIETLAAGDRIVTADGMKPLLWLGKSTIEPHPVRGHCDRNLPVLIEAGAFGPGAPARDLVLSWWHAVVLQGAWVQTWFGVPRLLVPAGRLIDGKRIRQLPAEGTLVYYNVLVEGHAVMFAEGMAVETCLPDGVNHVVFDNHTEFEGFRAPLAELTARFKASLPIIEADTDARLISANFDRLQGHQLHIGLIRPSAVTEAA